MNRSNDQVLMFHFKEELPMLVLTRKAGEKILIGHGIVLTVLEVQGNRARLGIEAPADVPVLRAELLGTEFAARRRLLEFGPVGQEPESDSE